MESACNRLAPKMKFTTNEKATEGLSSKCHVLKFLLEPKQMVWDVKLISVLTEEGQKGYKRREEKKKNWIPKARSDRKRKWHYCTFLSGLQIKRGGGGGSRFSLRDVALEHLPVRLPSKKEMSQPELDTVGALFVCSVSTHPAVTQIGTPVVFMSLKIFTVWQHLCTFSSHHIMIIYFRDFKTKSRCHLFPYHRLAPENASFKTARGDIINCQKRVWKGYNQ